MGAEVLAIEERRVNGKVAVALRRHFDASSKP
jgi:hypothetical protein